VLAIDTPTVFLTIEPKHFGDSNRFPVAFSEIMVKKGHVALFRNLFSNLANCVVLLMRANKKSGSKTIEPFPSSFLCRLLKPKAITNLASFFFSESNMMEVIVKIVFANKQRNLLKVAISIEGVHSREIFGIRVNIRVIGKTNYLMAVVSKLLKRINQAGTTTGMYQNPHSDLQYDSDL
jgi:hypothetical protein